MNKKYLMSVEQIEKAEQTILKSLEILSPIGEDLTKKILSFSIEEYKKGEIDEHSLSLVAHKLFFSFNTPKDFLDRELADFLSMLSEMSFFMHRSKDGDEMAIQKISELQQKIIEYK